MAAKRAPTYAHAEDLGNGFYRIQFKLKHNPVHGYHIVAIKVYDQDGKTVQKHDWPAEIVPS